jgi:hypothetical protein
LARGIAGVGAFIHAATQAGAPAAAAAARAGVPAIGGARQLGRGQGEPQHGQGGNNFAPGLEETATVHLFWMLPGVFSRFRFLLHQTVLLSPWGAPPFRKHSGSVVTANDEEMHALLSPLRCAFYLGSAARNPFETKKNCRVQFELFLHMPVQSVLQVAAHSVTQPPVQRYLQLPPHSPSQLSLQLPLQWPSQVVSQP